MREFATILLIASSLMWLPGSARGQHPMPHGNANWMEADEYVFLIDEVTDINITMDEADLDAFLSNPYLDYYVPCTARIVNSKLDEIYQDVGIRPRGNSQRSSRKSPWKLSFNEFSPGRKFHGIEKMNLASESTDPSMARETLAYEIMTKMGVAAGRTNHVWLTINDGTKVQGVFNNIEQVDENFLKAWFDNKDGDLYKCRWKDEGAKLLWKSPGDAATYEALDDYEEKISGSFQRLADFIDFVCNSDKATFDSGIRDWLNVDSFLRAQSVDMYLGQWDGLWIFPNNYYLYWDTETERFEYIPWDLDHSMGMDYWILPYFFGTDWARREFQNWGWDSRASQPGGGNGPPLIRRLLEIPEYVDRLASYEKELSSSIAHPATLSPSINRIFALLAPIAYTGTFSGSTMENNYTPSDFIASWDNPSSYSAFDTPATWGVRPFLKTRSAYVRDNYPAPQLIPPVCINELVAKNESGVTDEAGETEDWIELHNYSGQDFDLSGYYLSDRYGNPKAWRIPVGTVIPSNGYILIWCDNDDIQGPLHANFKLSSEGEGVYLFKPDSEFNTLVSSLIFPAMDDDEAWGRLPDGMRNVGLYSSSTPLAPNGTGAFELLKEGFVPDEQTLYAIGSTPNKPVAFVWSMAPGSFLVNGSKCSGITLGLEAPVTIASFVVAGFDGVATLNVPQGAAPSGIFVQSVDAETCNVSNVIGF